MWQKDTFDAGTIEREMNTATTVGFNCARVFVQYLVWESDPEGLKTRMDQLLQMASRHGIRIMWVLFDDCAFGGMTEPFLGKQPAVIPGEYGNGWTPSPGPSRARDRNYWPKLQQYVDQLMLRFRSDRRVLAWDLYNEPHAETLPLLIEVFNWARRTKPSQPVTVGAWSRQSKEVEAAILANSDVISFHNYGDIGAMTLELTQLAQTGRPLICTEWMARQTGSTIANILPLLYDRRVGSIIWGLVNGKGQANYHWGSKAGAPPPKIWQHDIFRGDLTPYDPSEVAFLRKYIKMRRAAASE
jgi:hypothetical protein